MQNTKLTKLEQGNIYFFYRPKVEIDSPRSLNDVQRLFFVLSPHGNSNYRLGAIPKKQLPKKDSSDHKFWAFIDKVTDDPKQLREETQAEQYQTKTKGTRHQPSMRPIGEGVYQISQHEDHTHLFYALELPDDPGPVQQEFNITEQGNFIISIKNPDQPSPQGRGLSESQEADYPDKLQQKFEDRRFIDANPPQLLDFEGTQLLLIAADANEIKELGINLKPQHETTESAEIFNDLKILKSKHPTVSLFQGTWA